VCIYSHKHTHNHHQKINQASDNEPGLLIALARLITALLPAVLDLQPQEEESPLLRKFKARTGPHVFIYLFILKSRFTHQPPQHTNTTPKPPGHVAHPGILP
jgi:hypothetical protein